MLDYEEQAIIKMYQFSSKRELFEKLNKSKEFLEDKTMLNKIEVLIGKLDKISLEDLLKCENIYE